MNSNNPTSQDYFDLPTYQADNISTLFHNNNNNDQHTSINNVEMSNTFIINTLPALQNDTFEFYFPLPNSARIYYVTYTELHPLENARLLNNSINLSRIPDHQLPHHYDLQSLIRQQIQQQGQQPVYQQNNVQQQFFDTTIQPTSDTNNNANNAASNSVNETISDNIQNTEFQNSY
ncbi:unnamed protein product [Rhizophagus irregularis]|uniref:Uncharacterized protein n=1 Tax=Rhizophagus irregularis TaxID=588596 RepID=A0A2I1HES5_9GLOM|nr:hypothetical protein RhiirA4_509839 [Rhizophagus irregularis]CAB4442796.1 unnamed protein product [Rhizophagus irregularis]